MFSIRYITKIYFPKCENIFKHIIAFLQNKKVDKLLKNCFINEIMNNVLNQNKVEYE